MEEKVYSVGFARLDITPPLGIDIPGGWNKKVGEGVLDPLYVNAIAFGDGEKTAFILSMDMLGIYGPMMQWKDSIAKDMGIEPDSLILCCTHSHTTPNVARPEADPLYDKWLYRRLCDAITMSKMDLKPVTEVSYAEDMAVGLTFVRRFLMKNGTVITRPPAAEMDQILRPSDENDESLRVIRFRRTDGHDIVIVNFQSHPDNIGGYLYSADFPGVMRNELEKLCENTLSVFINGAEGQMVTDNCAAPRIPAGPEKARNHGIKLAHFAAKTLEKAKPITERGLSYGQKAVRLKTKRDSSRIPEAQRIMDLWNAGKKEEIHPIAKQANYLFAESRQLLRLEANNHDYIDACVSAICFCGFALLGIPGEPFNEVGKQIRANSKFPATCVSCQANASYGYYPTAKAYDEGGYESYNTPYSKGTAEKLADTADQLLASL